MADNGWVALSTRRKERMFLWRHVRPDFAWALGTMVLTSLLLVPIMRLWRASLTIPFGYERDALFFLMSIKGLLRHGWILENPDLGAPFGQELYDVPIWAGSSFNLLLMKLLGVLSSDPSVTANLYFLLSFPLVALASFVVLRQLGASCATSLVCSVIYALAPYHFLRGVSHINLVAYYSVPVGAYLILSLLSGKALFTRRALPRFRVLTWASKRSLVTLALCLFIALSGGAYYAVFTGMILAVTMVIVFIARRDVQTLAKGSVLLVAIFGFLMLDGLPYLIYRFANGPNLAASHNAPYLWPSSETYSLSFMKMILPAPGHQIDALSSWANNYYVGSPINGEGPHQSLGFVATFGFAWLLVVALVGCLSPRWDIGDLRHRQLATATVIAFLIGTTGGISVLFAYLISPQIRSWGRLSIFIAFFAIAAVALLLDTLQQRMRMRRGRPILVGALLLSVLLVGLYDQMNLSFVPKYDYVKAQFRDDALFARTIDKELPPQAQVFQLPYVPFPETPPPEQMRYYDYLRPYLHASDLRWSSGAVKGRPAADWQAGLAGKPTEVLLTTVLEKDFDGIYIDRYGYPDHACKLEGELGKLLKAEPIVSPDGRASFFSLLPDKEGEKGTSQEREKGAFIKATPNPVPAGGGSGTTTISWSTGCEASSGEVYLVLDDGSEKLFAGQSLGGSQDAPWIWPNTVYEFRLYAGTKRATLLDQVKVTTSEQARESTTK